MGLTYIRSWDAAVDLRPLCSLGLTIGQRLLCEPKFCLVGYIPGADPGGGTTKLHKEGKKRCAHAREYTAF